MMMITTGAGSSANVDMRSLEPSSVRTSGELARPIPIIEGGWRREWREGHAGSDGRRAY